MEHQHTRSSDEVELGGDIFVQCPLVGFAHRAVKACAVCRHYGGLARATCDGEPVEGHDADKFQVICLKPITRRLTRVIME